MKFQERNLDYSPKLWARILLLFKIQDDTNNLIIIQVIRKDAGKETENIYPCFFVSTCILVRSTMNIYIVATPHKIRKL